MENARIWRSAPISAGCVDVWSCDLSGPTVDIIDPALLTHLGHRRASFAVMHGPDLLY
jgi:hypothetical protein